MKKNTCIIIAAVLLLCALLAGCSQNNASPSASPGTSAGASAAVSTAQNSGQVTEADVPYASDMVDNMLAGIKEKDYAKFSKDFTDTMKSAMKEDSLNQLADMLSSKIGDYESKTFGQAANVTQGGLAYTVIVYTAKYTKESGDVIITVSFIDNNGTKQIGGLNFNSPNLRAK